MMATPKYQAWPVITDADKQAVMAVLERGVLSGPLSPEVTALEREFADYLGVKYCLATNSGTAALHMALAALEIKPGDEVVVPAFTFVATAMAVLQQGATPIFADIELESFGLDPESFERAITPKTKAVIPVHLHGMPCDIEKINQIAKAHNISVIEDACQAPGATCQDQKVGTFGKLAAFSLQSSKNLACGEGGLLVTNDESCYKRAAQFRMFGENIEMGDKNAYDPKRPLDLKRSYDSVGIGYMYRMQELSAALARSQLKRLDDWNANGQRNAQILNEGLKDLPGWIAPKELDGRKSVYHKYRVQVSERDAVMAKLQEAGLEAVQWQTKILPAQTVFKNMGYSQDVYPNAQELIDKSFCLFSHTHPVWAQSVELCEHYVDVIRAAGQTCDSKSACA